MIEGARKPEVMLSSSSSIIGERKSVPERHKRRLLCRSSVDWCPALLQLLCLIAAASLPTFLLPFPVGSEACIMLLDGWSPMSVGDRAVHAEVVAFGYVRRLFRDAAAESAETGSSSLTYSDDERQLHASDAEDYEDYDDDDDEENGWPNTYTAELVLVRIVKGRYVIDQMDDTLSTNNGAEKLSLNDSQSADNQISKRKRRSAKVTPEAVKSPRSKFPATLQSSLPAAASTSGQRHSTLHGDSAQPVVSVDSSSATPVEKVDGARLSRHKTVTSSPWKPATPWPSGGKVYNVTNFGDSNACYADVSSDVETDTVPNNSGTETDDGLQSRRRHRVFFLTTFNGHLSARYDDLFGAVADLSRDVEDEIYEALGWTIWSDWSACSASCGGGTQARRRRCRKQPPVTSGFCEGEDEQRRKCNDFRCDGAKDLLTLTGVTSLPPGVTRVADRPTAYVIDYASSINAPSSTVTPCGFPANYSLLITARVRPTVTNNELPRGGGFIFTVNDMFGSVNVGVKLGRTFRLEHNNLAAIERGNSSICATKQQVPSSGSDAAAYVETELPLNLAGGGWHQLAVAVQTGSHVKLFFDCDAIVTRKWQQMKAEIVGQKMADDVSESVVSVGKAFVESSRYPRYEGDVEQLTLIPDDPEAAMKQCQIFSDFELLYQEEESPVSSQYVKKPPTEAEVDGRAAFVDASVISLPSQRASDLTTESVTPHAVVCSRPCLNGGRCVTPNNCRCRTGYTGRRCHQATCNPGCLNGGQCIAPNTCQCPSGTYGKACEIFLCSPPCLNNGVCIGLNTCQCPGAFSGDFCQTENCPMGCANGGLCVGPARCRCASEFEGPTCNRRKCDKRESVSLPYQRPYKKLFTTRITYRCGTLGLKTCIKDKQEYRTAYKTVYRTVSRCVP